MTSVKRRYRSPAREAQAARTRSSIIDAAAQLLAAGGLGGTTMESIAETAGVSVQTVYAAFGSKAGILLGLLDRLEAGAGTGRLARELRAAVGPREQAGSLAGFHRRMFERGADVIAASVGSVAADPDIAAHVRTGHDRRRASVASIVEAWAREGYLRAGQRPREAIDVAWALTSPELYLLFTRGSGWSATRYQRWLEDALVRSILEDPHPR